MLAGGLNPMYRAALATSHEPYLLVEVLDGSQQVLATDLVYVAGSVSATLTSRVARTCTIVLEESFYPYEPDGLLAPYGNMIRASRGVRYADGSIIAWTVFVGRIQETTLNADGTCTVYAADFAADVVENKFLTPQNSQAGQIVSTEVYRLIADAFPQAVFEPPQVNNIPVRALTWQLDRGQALDELATSVGAFWYPLADGTFTLRQYPWTVQAFPVITYTDGPSGSVFTSSATRSRETVYNILTVTGERLNGDTAVYASAADTNPANITFVDGNFGRRSQLLRLQTPGTQAAAQAAADDNLRRLVSLVDTWQWDMSPDAALELGDVVQLDLHGMSDIIQVVSSFTIPLDLSGPMRVQGRSQIIGVLEGVS